MTADDRPRAPRLRRSVGAALGGVVGATAIGSAARAQGLETETVGDPGATTIVRLVVVALLVLGLALTAVTVWFWRATRPDHPALGPLEAMSARRFARLGALEQQRCLDAVRPEGAEPDERSRSATVDAELVLDPSPPSTPTSGLPW